MTMNKFSSVEEEFIAMAEKPIDVSAILLKYLSYWKWFVLSVFLCFTIALIYTYFSLPKYQIGTSIVFKDEERGGGMSELNVFKEMGVVTRRSNVDNEVEILKKSLIVENVVHDLGLYVSYTELKPILPFEINGLEDVLSKLPHRKAAILYGDESPVKLTLSENTLNNMVMPVLFEVDLDVNGRYTFTGEYQKDKFHILASSNDTIIRLPFGVLQMEKGNATLEKDMKIEVVINHPRDAANYYLSNIEIELTSKTSSVADITFETYNMNLGKDFLDSLIYNHITIKG